MSKLNDKMRDALRLVCQYGDWRQLDGTVGNALVRRGLAERRRVFAKRGAYSGHLIHPEHWAYRITSEGRALVDGWLAEERAVLAAQREALGIVPVPVWVVKAAVAHADYGPPRAEWLVALLAALGRADP